MKVSSLSSPFCYNKKAFQAVLWWVWLVGLLLIGVSFYATQKLPSSLTDDIKNPKAFEIGFGDLGSPKITIFTAPRPFTGSDGARQSLAVKSWLGLSPDITVVLFSQDPSVVSFAGALGSRVSVEPNIDFTFMNTPFFHSMVARSQASTSDISVLIDPETILLADFITTLNYAYKLDRDWLLVASSRSTSYYPFHLDADGKQWLAEDGKRIKTQKLQGILAHIWQWKRCEGRMLMAWNNGDIPLHTGVLPPFLYGKGLHYHWVINEALSSDYRFVFDASLTTSNFYLQDLDHGSHQLVEGSDISDIGKTNWENVGNSHLGVLYGSLYFHEANYSNLVKFFKCDGQYVFVNTAENIVYPLGYQKSVSLRSRKISGFGRSFRSLNGIRDCSVKDQLKSSTSLSLPFSLELLLSMLADQNKTIVLAIAGYSYKDMLMSWVCRLRHLMISNFLVCALDQEIYDFCVLQGLPVFKDSFAPTNVSFNDCHFGTKCFQRVTKVKSRVVLQILKLGYNVLLSDVDVYWFKNPLPLLYSYGSAVLVAQSDEYNTTGPINLPRRLNSGFYYVHSDGSTITALEKVVMHAATSNLSEQPSFYDTLCGEGGSNRVGANRCFEPETKLTVHFLDRNLFPNGAYQGLWEENDVKEACMKKGCFILHNNWISGRKKKLERQVLSGLWAYDISTRMCWQSWHKNKFKSYF
ncbi:beta-arabinofuranosyltransferase RAY1 [Cornus florida]|uniref:beta-arabinofuranosyltransferase RAY1 n=1 Tax=Cornus florida TaxID=4283 RepID=UPI0028984451|nr:beta-arabinofuranosyltransferase RAY1 [Cornus florida]